jgi:hypothetical protein
MSASRSLQVPNCSPSPVGRYTIKLSGQFSLAAGSPQAHPVPRARALLAALPAHEQTLRRLQQESGNSGDAPAGIFGTARRFIHDEVPKLRGAKIFDPLKHSFNPLHGIEYKTARQIADVLAVELLSRPVVSSRGTSSALASHSNEAATASESLTQQLPDLGIQRLRRCVTRG